MLALIDAGQVHLEINHLLSSPPPPTFLFFNVGANQIITLDLAFGGYSVKTCTVNLLYICDCVSKNA
jgi:hypothetical protein